MRSPVVAERLGGQSFVPTGTSPNDFTAFIAKEVAIYTLVVRDASIRID